MARSLLNDNDRLDFCLYLMVGRDSEDSVSVRQVRKMKTIWIVDARS